MASTSICISSDLTLRGLSWCPCPDPQPLPSAAGVSGLCACSQRRRCCLMLHGWMDNASSFLYVGPALARAGLYALALDLPGHGMSDHRPPSAFYGAVEYAATLAEAIEVLGWDQCCLLGHSLGAGLAPLLAGSLPDRIAGLICLDGLGPSPRPDEDAAQQFRAALDAKAGALRGGVGSCYASLEAAVDARLATVARHPGSHATGSQYLSRGAATALVQRALVEEAPGRWRWRHDRRVIGPSLAAMSEPQVLAFLRSVRCPALLIEASAGWPRDIARYAWRAEALAAAAAPLFAQRTLPGGHHLHADEETQGEVCGAIREWVMGVMLPAWPNKE